MSRPARQLERKEAPKPEPRHRRAPRVYRLVEIPPAEEDPKAAEALLEWLAQHLG